MTRIFFSVGEPSGDVHGANLIRHLQAGQPSVECVGYGGPRMAAAGARLHYDLTQLAVMWFARAALHLPEFWGLVGRAERVFRHHRVDAVVMIDYPGLNWWIARRAKRHGIPVFYYGTPQLWAWAPWRIRKMRRLVDHVLCKLPFEAEWFTDRGCHATYVGHPYFDETSRQQFDEGFVDQQQDTERPLIVLLPGSRAQEVATNLPVFLRTAGHIRDQVKNVRFAVASFNGAQGAVARRLADVSGLEISVHVGRTAELIHLAHSCLACSGSVSLELLYHQKPTVIHYRISRAAMVVQRRFRKVKYITLVNLLAGSDIFQFDGRAIDPDSSESEVTPFPEYLTDRDRSTDMARHLVRWLTEPQEYTARCQWLGELRRKFGRPGASHRAAQYILERITSGKGPSKRRGACDRRAA